MLRAGKPMPFIQGQLGHAGPQKINDLYGRFTRSQSPEPFDLDAFFLAIAKLPKAATAKKDRPNRPNASPTRPLRERQGNDNAGNLYAFPSSSLVLEIPARIFHQHRADFCVSDSGTL